MRQPRQRRGLGCRPANSSPSPPLTSPSESLHCRAARAGASATRIGFASEWIFPCRVRDALAYTPNLRRLSKSPSAYWLGNHGGMTRTPRVPRRSKGLRTRRAAPIADPARGTMCRPDRLIRTRRSPGRDPSPRIYLPSLRRLWPDTGEPGGSRRPRCGRDQ